jgi:hypothetical protein
MYRRKPFRQFVHLDDDLPEHIAYEVHLDPPYVPEGAENDPSKWVGHYIGSAERDRLMERVYQDHGTVNGARVLQVQKAAGGSWHLVRTWAGGREKELQLKQQSGTRYCPECSPHPKQADSEPTGRYKTRRQRREAQRAREAPQFELVSNCHGEDAQCHHGLSPAEVRAILRGEPEEKLPEMSEPEQLARIEQLEATWRTPVPERQAAPKARELELEAG